MLWLAHAWALAGRKGKPVGFARISRNRCSRDIFHLFPWLSSMLLQENETVRWRVCKPHAQPTRLKTFRQHPSSILSGPIRASRLCSLTAGPLISSQKIPAAINPQPGRSPFAQNSSLLNLLWAASMAFADQAFGSPNDKIPLR